MNSLRGAVMANRVDIAVRQFPGVVAAPLVLGTVAGSGGRLCVDLILHLYGNLTGAPALIYCQAELHHAIHRSGRAAAAPVRPAHIHNGRATPLDVKTVHGSIPPVGHSI